MSAASTVHSFFVASRVPAIFSYHSASVSAIWRPHGKWVFGFFACSEGTYIRSITCSGYEIIFILFFAAKCPPSNKFPNPNAELCHPSVLDGRGSVVSTSIEGIVHSNVNWPVNIRTRYGSRFFDATCDAGKPLIS